MSGRQLCSEALSRGRAAGQAHEIIAAVADSEVVKFFEGDTALTFANVAGNRVVDGAVGNQQRALLALALAVHFDANDGENKSFVSSRI